MKMFRFTAEYVYFAAYYCFKWFLSLHCIHGKCVIGC